MHCGEPKGEFTIAGVMSEEFSKEVDFFPDNVKWEFHDRDGLNDFNFLYTIKVGNTTFGIEFNADCSENFSGLVCQYYLLVQEDKGLTKKRQVSTVDQAKEELGDWKTLVESQRV